MKYEEGMVIFMDEFERCPVYKKCGGCQMQNLTYQEQLLWKQKRCEILLGKYCKVEPIKGMYYPFHYRTKVQAAFGKDRKGNIKSGIYQSSTHNIINVDSCLTENKVADKIIVTIRKLVAEFGLSVYDEITGTGFLRHVLVRVGLFTKQVMVVLVVGTPVFKDKKDFIKTLLSLHPEINTVVMNVNDKYTSMVLGDNQKVLYGNGYIEDRICGKKFRISPRSFYQINPMQMEVMYNIVREFSELNGQNNLLDAYCGVGTLGIILADYCKSVTGVEINSEAVSDAECNKQINGTRNIKFICSDAGQYISNIDDNNTYPDIIVMDPPRSGSSVSFLKVLKKENSEKIIYVSCNPETLQRDIDELLKDSEYKVKKIQPIDMFPMTNHVETVALMSRNM
jgi:23S rRNA (uracil1939-C5)-methyltransferase